METILHPFAVAFAYIWVYIHKFLVILGVPDGPGIGWVIAIVLMTLVVRTAIIPLYVKQIRSTRNMQMIQPELQKIQAKYKGKTDPASRQRQNEETMALYKKNGSSPFASCWPMLVQMPILFGLYRVIIAVSQIAAGTYQYESLGPLDSAVAANISASKFLGVGLSQTLSTSPGFGAKAAFIVLIIIMVGMQFLTMRLSMSKNMNLSAMDPSNPMVRSQKTMMYLMPLMFVFSGLVFQMGMLVYMVTGTLYGYVQQLVVVRTIPTPGSPAHDELMAKRETKYQQWAGPMFDDFDQKVTAAEGDQEVIAAIATQTLPEVQKQAKKQRVNSGFPDDWSDSEKLAVYRNLAVSEWKTIPDELWMKQLVMNQNSAKAAQEARKNRPKKMSREQRMKRAQIEAQQAADDAKRSERQARKEQDRAKSGGNLTPEEVERRRQQRRQERRNQSKKNKGQGK